MANKRTYSIELQGIEDAVKHVENLRDVLEQMTTSTKKNIKVDEEANEERQKQNKSMSELEKVIKKVNEYDKEYQKQVQEAKGLLSAKNKEVKDEIKLENDLAIIEANRTNTYNETQQLMSALGRVMKNINLETAEGRSQVEDYQLRYKELNDRLKSFDQTIGNMQRNVGNYRESIDGIKVTINGTEQEFTNAQEACEKMEKALATMALQGEKDTEVYQQLFDQLVEMRQAVTGVKSEIDTAVKSSSNLQAMIDISTSATSAIGLWQSSMVALGIESEEFENILKKLQATQTALNSLQAINKQLMDRSSGTYALYNKVLELLGKNKKADIANTTAQTTAQEANTVATKGATVATKGLGTAFKALGIGLIVSAVAYLVDNWDNLTKSFKEFVGISGDTTGAFDKIKEVVSGVGNAILQFVLTPMKTVAVVVKNILAGDFKKAFSEGLETVKSGYDVIGNYQKGALDQQKANQEAHNKEMAKKYYEDGKKYAEIQEAKHGADWKYTQEGRAVYEAMFRNRLNMYDKDSDEYKATQLDKLKWDREVKEQAKKINEERLRDLQAFQDKINKMEQENRYDTKRREENLKTEKENLKKIQVINEEALNTRVRFVKMVADEEVAIEREKTNKNINSLQEEFEATMKIYREKAKTDKKYQDLMLQYAQAHNEALLRIEQGFADKRSEILRKADEDIIESQKKLDKITQEGIEERMKNILKNLEYESKKREEQEKKEEERLAERKKKIEEGSKEIFDRTISSISQVMSIHLQNANSYLDKLGDISDKAKAKVEETEQHLESLQQRMIESSGAEKEALQQQIAEEQVLLQQRNAEAKRAEDERIAQEKKTKKEELRMNMLSTISSIATGVANDLKKGIPLGPIFASMTTALGAVQIANTIKQMNQLEDGGLLVGNRHSQGGIKVGNTGIEVEGGEYVVNRRSTAKYLPLLQQINAEGANGSSHGGKYAEGGQLDFGHMAKVVEGNADANIIKAIKSINMQPVVSVVDIEKKQKSLARVRDMAGN